MDVKKVKTMHPVMVRRDVTRRVTTFDHYIDRTLFSMEQNTSARTRARSFSILPRASSISRSAGRPTTTQPTCARFNQQHDHGARPTLPALANAIKRYESEPGLGCARETDHLAKWVHTVTCVITEPRLPFW